MALSEKFYDKVFENDDMDNEDFDYLENDQLILQEEKIFDTWNYRRFDHDN